MYIDKNVIRAAQEKEQVDKLFEGCLCGGGDFGVFQKGDLIYKISPLDAIDDDRSIHRDAIVLRHLNNDKYFPKLLHAEVDYVIMTFEEGTPLDIYVEEEGNPFPEWAIPQIHEVIEYVINERDYNPYELEPRHVLIDDSQKKIKVIDVTAYYPLKEIEKNKEYKQELIEYYQSLF